jgi:hypothetical protein
VVTLVSEPEGLAPSISNTHPKKPIILEREKIAALLP